MYDKVLGNGYVMTVLCLMILDIILVLKLKKTEGFGRQQTWILVMLLACIFCSMSDAFCIIIGDNGTKLINYLLNFGFNFTFCFVSYYLFVHMERAYHPERHGRVLWELLYALPLLITTFMLIASYWTGWIFYIDDTGKYIRGSMYLYFFFFLGNGYTIYSILLILLRLIRETDNNIKHVLKCCLSYILPITIGTCIQVFIIQFPGASLGLSVTMVMIFLTTHEMLLSQALQNIKENQAVLREALSQAKTANRAKTTFLNSMSHDIRTPMNAIIGFTSLAQDNMDNKEQVKEYLEKINTSGKHLLNLINDILDMSRIESGSVKLDLNPVYIPEVLNELQTMIQELLNEKKQRLRIEKQDIQHAYVMTDKLRLNQILLNLLSNSIKYTPEGGNITIRLTEKPCQSINSVIYEFSIKDDGIGMSQEFMRHIFDAFSRERTVSVNGIQGTGLGMAITKNIVDMMGGTIKVNSEEGRGSTFTVTLKFPLADESVQYVPQSNTEQCDYSNKRILLVEDNELNREIAMALLEETGITIDVATDGIEAVEIINEAPESYYDLILMDIQMPRMDGYTATREIRTLSNNNKANIPIVAMTANAFEEDRKKAFEVGMNGHIAKPIDLSAIVSTLNPILKK